MSYLVILVGFGTHQTSNACFATTPQPVLASPLREPCPRVAFSDGSARPPARKRERPVDGSLVGIQERGMCSTRDWDSCRQPRSTIQTNPPTHTLAIRSHTCQQSPARCAVLTMLILRVPSKCGFSLGFRADLSTVRGVTENWAAFVGRKESFGWERRSVERRNIGKEEESGD